MTDKFLLIIFKSKSAINFESYQKIVADFSSFGYNFDKISFVDYTASKEIASAVQAGVAGYENIVIYCPSTMGETLKIFIEGVAKSTFDSQNRLLNGNRSIYLQFSDGKNALVTEDIAGDFDKKYSQKFCRACVKLIGAPSAKIKEAIEGARAICADIEFNITEKHGDCKIELIYKSDVPKLQFDGAWRSLLSALTEYTYAIEDESLAERVVKLLKLRRLKFSTAESFTGGGISKKITSVSGASEVFFEGLNTYANGAKAGRLGVRQQSLDRFGAVSEEVCAQMAEGLIAGGNCDVALSTTGIAGPKSDNTKKPVGLAYIGVATREGTKVYKFNLKGSREDITETAINFALFLAFKSIK